MLQFMGLQRVGHDLVTEQQPQPYEKKFQRAKFRTGRGTRDQIANIQWIIEKAIKLHRNIYFCFIDYAQHHK